MKNVAKIKEIYVYKYMYHTLNFLKKLIKNKELYNKEIFKSNY